MCEFLHARLSLCLPMSVHAHASLQQDTLLGNVSMFVCVHYDCTR